MHRILLVGLGPLGVMFARDIARRNFVRMAAAVDIDPALAGKTLAQVAPESGLDIPIHRSLNEVRNWSEIDCAVVATASALPKCAETFRSLLSSGVSVVSTCEELTYPWLRHRALAAELDALAKENSCRLLGTGVNPGFLMDTLPVAATAVCRSVSRVHCWRIQDATTRRLPFQKKIGAGLTEEQFAARIKDGSLRHVGLGESLHFIADYLGLKIDKWDETIEPVKTDRMLMCALGLIETGQAAGVRQVAKGWTRGGGDPEPVIQMEFQAAIGQLDPHDRVQIEGEPPIDLVIRGGVHGDVATTAITLNAIPSLLSAPPGLHTMATIPLVRCVPNAPRTK